MNTMMQMILILGIITMVHHLPVIGEAFLKHVMIPIDHIPIHGRCLDLLKNQHGGTANTLLQHTQTMVVVINHCGKI